MALVMDQGRLGTQGDVHLCVCISVSFYVLYLHMYLYLYLGVYLCISLYVSLCPSLCVSHVFVSSVSHVYLECISRVSRVYLECVSVCNSTLTCVTEASSLQTGA